MRNANEALKVTKAVEKILSVFEEEKLSEEEMPQRTPHIRNC
jgi:hypothetical protein